VILKLFSKEEWAPVAALAHKACFYEDRPDAQNTFDFVMVAEHEEGKAIAYATILEIDSKTAYMQHGGAFLEIRGKYTTLRTYQMMVNFLKGKYSRISTRVWNQNIPMLKMAMSQGLIIQGIDVIDGTVHAIMSWSKPSEGN